MTEAQDQLQKLTECCICFQPFTDHRTLPCFHTFCLDCLEKTGEATNKKPGEYIPCPVCRKEFVVPAEGMNGIPKNFIMQDLMDVTKMLQLCNKPLIVCDMCTALHEGVEEKTKEATMRCLECEDNFCDMCSKAHKLLKPSKTHSIVKIGSETEEDTRKMQPTRNCTVHNQQPLNFYCIDCKKILCVSCFVENHKSHDCKDVTTVHKEFRDTIEMDAMKISICAEEILSKGRIMEQRKVEVILNLAETEDKIRQRNLELKEMIDSDTNSLLEDLSLIKKRQMKDFANEKEEIDRSYVRMKSFESYCTELRSKGSANDICCCVDDLMARANELERDHEAFIGRPFQTNKVTFESTEVNELLSHSSLSFVGRIECTLGLIGSDISSRHQSNSSETSDDFHGNLEDLAEKISCESAISPDGTKAQTLGGYKRLLVDLCRKIADAGNDHSKITTFSEEEIAKFHSLDYLEDVKRELGLSDASKRFDGIQAKHTRMAALLFEMTKPDSDSSSAQLKSHLTELLSCIKELWNMIQFLVHRRNSERTLMPRGFQNFGNTCYFNSVLQCLLQTVLLSFGLNLNLHVYDLGNVLTGFTLSEVFMELASKYNYSEQSKRALHTLYYKFKETTQRFSDPMMQRKLWSKKPCCCSMKEFQAPIRRLLASK